MPDVKDARQRIATNISDVYTHVQRTFIIKILLFFLDEDSWTHRGDLERVKVLVEGNGVDGGGCGGCTRSYVAIVIFLKVIKKK